MQHWQVFEDCRADVAFGGAWLSGSEAKLVDCHFLRCHAGEWSSGGKNDVDKGHKDLVDRYH